MLAGFLQIIFQTANFAMERFKTISHEHFFFKANMPIGQIVFEMSIFIQWSFCVYLCGTVSTLQLNTLVIVLIESILSLLLIYLLGKWIDKVKEPYC